MRPPEYHLPRDFGPARGFLVRLLLIVFVLVAGFQSIGFYIENLWFESLGFESVYWYRLRAQFLVFLAFAVTSSALLWALFRLVIPASSYGRPSFVEFAGERLVIPAAGHLRPLIAPVAIVIGIFIGLSFSTDWTSYALFLNHPENTGAPDPIYGRPLSFFLFTLPIWESVSSWALAISMLTLVAAAVLALTDTEARFRGVSVGLGLLLLALAAKAFIRRYTLLLDQHALFTGISYVDANVIVPGLWFVIVALILGSILAIANIRFAHLRNIVIAIAVPALTYVVAGVLIPWYVTTFVVRPNELARETPYIANNIAFTRQAYGLDQVEEIQFEPRATNAIFSPEDHTETLENIRLWDWRALQDTLGQIQEIRTYYDFADVDVDRYLVNGQKKAMMLATRELSLNQLPAGSRNWLNERLIYTHGYGVTMNPVSQFTREGQPQLILSNMPVESSIPEIRVTRPEIYFGELTDWPVYVKTSQTEFNYPAGETNNYNTHDGTGGIRIGGFFRQLALAFTVGDIARVPFSDDITSESALLMRRNIRERVTTLAPFLIFDDDPYIVVGEDGNLYWMMDAFTVSDQYPYSRHLVLGNRSVNYMRNSVKAIVNAYNGLVQFYVFDAEDPIIQAWQGMLPELFKPSSDMPEFLRHHIRYPELLFQVQASLYTTYHVDDVQVFYNREDLWTVAQQGRSQTGGEASDIIESFYVLMKFPGESELEFVAILPFTPANRNNLIGWLGARSDGEHYGKLRAYHFPKSRFIDGPLQIQARMDQDAQLSSQLTLWNQQGSTVIRGNLLVIPMDDILLFAEPIYLQAQRSPMPELRLVALATQDRLAYAPTFQQALDTLIQGGRSNLTPTSSEQTRAQPAATPSASTPSSTPSPPSSSIPALIDQANQALVDYRRLTAEGRLGEAGMKLDELKLILEEMNRR